MFDIDKNYWKVLNYIADKEKLSILHAGAMQISSQKIMIFGGIVPLEEQVANKDQKEHNLMADKEH